MRKPVTPQRDLPGLAVPRGEAPKDATPVEIPMQVVSAGTDKAWFLKPLGTSSAKAGFAPRALVTRGEGDRASIFTLPKWLAKERGWL